MAHDYLAIVPIGGGSSHGRSPDKEKAIELAIKFLKDWTVYYDLSGVEVTVNVVDVQGYSDVSWGYNDMHGKNEKTGEYEKIDRPFEYVKRMTPKWRVKKAR